MQTSRTCPSSRSSGVRERRCGTRLRRVDVLRRSRRRAQQRAPAAAWSCRRRAAPAPSPRRTRTPSRAAARCSVPSAMMPKPNQIQFTSGLTHDLDVGRLLLPRRTPAARCRGPRRTCGGWPPRSSAAFSCLRKNQLGRIHLRQLGCRPEHGHVRRHHLLLAVVGDLERIEADGVVADRHLLAGLERAPSRPA